MLVWTIMRELRKLQDLSRPEPSVHSSNDPVVETRRALENELARMAAELLNCESVRWMRASRTWAPRRSPRRGSWGSWRSPVGMEMPGAKVALGVKVAFRCRFDRVGPSRVDGVPRGRRDDSRDSRTRWRYWSERDAVVRGFY